ncbi:sulfotransferase family protein [Flavihumibacter profundi]|uniref:sulfotransferase family protein n=1 Tax=Flavihumibacter profundi TaxID=2716883 RepID=UPI001CC5D3C8|nr:sulfotransferase [Flavihumibacter profundi]MBZ5859389.1 sulfotransferase [Flavihumibacter profundi]
MKRLFPLPIYTFLKITFENGGVSTKGLKNILPWLIKTILFEPLRWIELVSQNKKISQHTITKDPVFILGFYRSGTSYLHQLLTKDDRLGYHSNFQMVLPEIMLSSEKILGPVFEFICRVFKLRDSVHRVPLSFRFPGEEDATMTTSINPRGAQWGYFFPNMMNEYFHKYVLFENIPASEFEAWKKEYIFLLKKISLANQSKQLVLKSPPNTARIKHLLSLFPDAKFIFIHRNPYEVYVSNKRFWKVTQKIFALGGARKVDDSSVILDTYAKMMHRYLLEKELVPEGQLIEIPYEELIQKPLESMRKIYETIRLDDFGYCENEMRSFVGRQERFVRLKHEIPAEERKVVTEKLEPIINHWNYPFL